MCHTDTFLFPNCIIITQSVLQSFISLVYHTHHCRSLWMLIFIWVISKSQITIGFFHIILCWRLIQTKNMIIQIITLLILRVLDNWLKNNSLCSFVKTVWLGVSNSHIFVLAEFLEEIVDLHPLLHFSGKYYLQCVILTIWSVVFYRPVISSLTCSCLWNFFWLSVLLSNVGFVASRI